MHLPFKNAVSVYFACRIFNGFISPSRTDFSSAFYVFFQTHRFAHMRQTLVNIRSFFILSFAQLPMLYSDSLLYFCSLLIFKHAEFLLRPICLYPRNSCLSREIFRASPSRRALVYRHNDIIVLVIGIPNSTVIHRNLLRRLTVSPLPVDLMGMPRPYVNLNLDECAKMADGNIRVFYTLLY